jgi:glycosyltransferase involved in cell wall biosynthesis
MRIAVWHNLPSGGGKRALYAHVRGLVQRGHTVEAWCSPAADRTYCPLSDWVQEHVVELSCGPDGTPKSRLGRFYAPTLAWLRAMHNHCRRCAEEINRGGFDLLLASSSKFFAVAPIGRYVRIPPVLYLQEPTRQLYEAFPRLLWPALETPEGWWRSPGYLRCRISDSLRTRVRRIQAREELINVRAFGSILVNSQYSRESVLRAYGIDAKVCYLGVDTSLFVDQQKARGNWVVGVGGFRRHKNIELVVQALSLVKHPRPPLIWIGNDVDEPYLKQLVELAKSCHVEFQPRLNLPDSQLVDILNCAKIMAYAPRLEPLGLAPLEANACGLPVAAVAEGGVRETVVDGVNGLLVEHDPRSLASAIQRLLDDLELARRLGENGRNIVADRWTTKHSVDRLESRLFEALEGVDARSGR